MDFSLSKSQKGIQKAAKEFAAGEFDKDLAATLDKEGRFPEKIWKKAAQLGLVGVHLGGDCANNLMLTDHVLVAQALCAKDSGFGTAVLNAGRGAECLFLAGNEKIKDRFLYPVLGGSKICALAFQEAGCDPDFLDIRATAVQEEETLVLNGEKIYVLNADNADFFIVLCRIFSVEEPKAKISMVIVEKDFKGILISPKGEKLGTRMSPLADITFSDVMVPVSNIVGNPGNGLSIASKFLSIDRISLAAMAVGIAKGALDRSLVHTKMRKQFNTVIAAFEVTQHKLADMAIKIRKAELLTFEAAWHIDQGNFEPHHSAMALSTAAKIAVDVADEAVQLLGGYGYMTEYEVERFYRDAKAIEISHPSGPWLKNIVAKKVLGKIKKT